MPDSVTSVCWRVTPVCQRVTSVCRRVTSLSRLVCRQDLEQGLLAERDESPLLQQLLVRLLQGCLPEYDVSLHNWQHYLRRLLKFKCLVSRTVVTPCFLVCVSANAGFYRYVFRVFFQINAK